MSLRNKKRLIQKILNKQEALLSFHDVTVRGLESRLTKYKGMIESMREETQELRKIMETESVGSTPQSNPLESLSDTQQVRIFSTHKLMSWMFLQIVCVNELNPKVVASDMMDLLRATYLPLILRPMVDFEYGYEIPENFYEARPGDFAKFILNGRILLSDFLKEIGNSHLNEERNWEGYANRVHSWLVTEGFPLLYGVGDDEWYETEPLTWGQYFNEGENSKGYVLTAESYLEKYNHLIPTDFSSIERSLTDKMVELVS